MVSQCKICGERTAGHRQYCPNCRRTHKGRRRSDPFAPLIKEIAPLIINGLPFLILFFGYYQITLGKIGFGILLLLFGALFWWGMIYSKRQRERFHDRILGTKTDLKSLDNKPDKFGVTAFWIGIVVFLIIMLFVIPPTQWVMFNHGESQPSVNDSGINNLQDNSPPNQETISPEEELVNSCISKFSNGGIFDLKKTGYQDDFSSASEWIRDNYENSALTQEQKEHNINYIIENQLPKQGYPIVITDGSKKDGQITSQGFYYCNENGIIN